jgi:hypothetical protein
MKLEIRVIPPTGDPIELSFEEARALYETLKSVFEGKKAC